MTLLLRLYARVRERWNEHFSSKWYREDCARMNAVLARRQEDIRRFEELVRRRRA